MLFNNANLMRYILSILLIVLSVNLQAQQEEKTTQKDTVLTQQLDDVIVTATRTYRQ